MKIKTSNWIVFSIILVLAYISRIPQLLSPLLFVDGDECVVATMAKHLIEGKEFPVFFYGQKYGFSLFEVIPAAIAFKLFGVSVSALKLSMIPLWAGGTYFLFKSAQKMGGNYDAWAIALFMLSMPAWASWCMKARGGYLTAFFFTAWLLYLLVKYIDSEKNKIWPYICSGIMLAIIFKAQQLWLPGILPFLIYYILKRGSYIKTLGVMGSAFGATCVIILLLGNISPNTDWWHPVFTGNYVSTSLPLLKQRVFDVMQGTYNMYRTVFIGGNTDSVAGWWVAAAYLFAIIQLIRLVSRRYYIYSHLFMAGILLTLSYTLFSNPVFYGARHLLPLPQLIAGGLALEMSVFFRQGILLKVPALAYTIILVIMGFLSVNDFKKMDEGTQEIEAGHSRMADMQIFIAKLNALNIHHFFCANSLLEWQIDFLSNEKLIGANSFYGSRYQPYPLAVDSAFKMHKPMADIGTRWEIENFVLKKIPPGEHHDIIYCNADLWAVLYPKKPF